MLESTTSKLIFRLAVLCMLAFSCAAVGFAQQEQPDLTIDAATRTQVVDSIVKRINDSYVFPEVAKKMTDDLQAVSHDKHLRVRYSHEAIPEREPRREPTAEEREQRRRELTRMNHGFAKVERLPGNIGYLEFLNFM